jgi:hypothetical protein
MPSAASHTVTGGVIRNASWLVQDFAFQLLPAAFVDRIEVIDEVDESARR